MQLRKATENDAAGVVKLFEAAKAMLNARGIDQWDEAYPDEEILLRDIGAGEMYVAGTSGAVDAAVVLNGQCDPLYDRGSWRYPERSFTVIHRLCVNPACQSRGMGTALVQEIERLERSRGIQVIRLDAFSRNPISLRMYERLGYRKAGEVRFRKGLFFLYEKYLTGEA